MAEQPKDLANYEQTKKLLKPAVEVPPERWSAEWFGENFSAGAKAALTDVANATHVVNLHAKEEQSAGGLPEQIVRTAGTLAVVAPVYAGFAKLTGATARSIAVSNGWEANAFGKFAASERLTGMAGAAIYDVNRPTHGDETRLGNVAAGLTTFGLMNTNFSSIGNVAKSFPQNFLAGAVGAGTGEVLGTNHTVSVERMIAGGAGGAVIPVAQHAFLKVGDVANHVFERGVPINRYVQSKGLDMNVDVQNTDARLLRVREDVGGARIENGRTVIIPKDASPAEAQQLLRHEVGHKLNQGVAEQEYLAAAKQISANPEAARQQFIGARQKEEQFARQFETDKGAQPRELTEKELLSYTTMWKSEADRFVQSGGTYRPEVSFGHGGDGPSQGYQNPGYTKQGFAAATPKDPFNVQMTKLEQPREVTIDGRVYLATEHGVVREQGDPGALVKYEKIKTINDYTVEFFGGGKVTDFGVASTIETGPKGVFTRYKITKPPEPNPEFIREGSVYEVYPDSVDSLYGPVHTIERQANGDVVLRNKGQKLDEKFITWEYATPDKGKFGDHEVDFVSTTQHANDAYTWRAADKSTLYQLPDGVTIAPKIDGVPLQGIRSIFRSPDGTVVYEDASNVQTSVRPLGDTLQVTTYKDGVAQGNPVTAKRLVEEYAKPVPVEQTMAGENVTNRVVAQYVELLPGSTRIYGQGRVIEMHTPPKDMPYGTVYRSEHIANANREFETTVDYLQKGMTYTEYNKPRRGLNEPVQRQPKDSQFGLAQGHWTDPEGNITFDVRGMAWPQQHGDNYSYVFEPSLSTTLDNVVAGRVVEVQRSLDNVAYVTSSNEVVNVPLRGGNITIKGADGAVRSTPENSIKELFGQLQPTPYGLAKSIEVRTDGVVTYTLADNSHFDVVKQFLNPLPTNQGGAMYAKHLRTGGWLLMMDSGKMHNLNDQQFFTLFRG